MQGCALHSAHHAFSTKQDSITLDSSGDEVALVTLLEERTCLDLSCDFGLKDIVLCLQKLAQTTHGLIETVQLA